MLETTEWNDKSGFASIPLCRISLNFANLVLNKKESIWSNVFSEWTGWWGPIKSQLGNFVPHYTVLNDRPIRRLVSYNSHTAKQTGSNVSQTESWRQLDVDIISTLI